MTAQEPFACLTTALKLWMNGCEEEEEEHEEMRMKRKKEREERER